MPPSRKSRVKRAAALLASALCISALPDSGRATNYRLESLIKVAQIIAADAPPLLTFYGKGDWKGSVNPAYVTVSRIVEEPFIYIEGDGLRGWGGNASFAYGLDDRWMVYGMLTTARFSGRSVTYSRTWPTFSSATPSWEENGWNSLFVWSFGTGYDVLGGRRDGKWSAPFFAGLLVEKYRAKGNAGPIPGGSYVGPGYDISADGMLLGISTGIQVARRLGKHVEVSPYFIFHNTFNLPTIKLRVNSQAPQSPPVGTTYENKEGRRHLPIE